MHLPVLEWKVLLIDIYGVDFLTLIRDSSLLNCENIVTMPSLPKKYKLISSVPVSKETLPKIRVSRLMPTGHGKCVRCGVEATRVLTYTIESENHRVVYSNIFAESRMMTADHILPRAFGGADAISNLQLMCTNCNAKKGTLLSPSELDLIIKNRLKHLRPSFRVHQMLQVIKQFPAMAVVYNLSGQEESKSMPFKTPPIQRRKSVVIYSNGMVNNKHPHHPMLGWLRIFEKFPEMKSVVRFA